MSKLHEALIHKLHPTQLTVGMIEVNDKKKHLHSLTADQQTEFMRAHPIPAVLGTEGKLYITDHHHLGRAAFEANVEKGFFEVEADFSTLADEDFWKEMDKSKWVHPVDENGVRHTFEKIPRHLEKLIDDPYRSLAGYVRNGGGYTKTPTAFAEFVWADFFRKNITAEEISKHFEKAVQKAIALAQSPDAKDLPGYHGGAK